jgi:iron complex transport system ATP-binding protein
MSAALACENLSLSLDGREVLGGVTAEFRSGEVTGIVGPNGAGKTTLLRACAGILKPSGGTICIQNKPPDEWPRERLARVCAYLPQGGEAGWPMTAWDVAMLGRLPHRSKVSAHSAEDIAAAEEALARCDALRFASRRMNNLSAGERALVLMARALATRAKILLADEPAAYLDPAHQLRLMEILRGEAKRGAAVAVTMHDLTLAARHCDRLIVLHEGRVAAAGAPPEALSDEVLARVFAIEPERDEADARPRLPAAFRRI